MQGLYFESLVEPGTESLVEGLTQLNQGLNFESLVNQGLYVNQGLKVGLYVNQGLKVKSLLVHVKSLSP